MQGCRCHLLAVLAGLLLLVGQPRCALAERWMEVRSPHFRVVTNGSATDGRRVVTEFEEIRYVIHYRFPTLRLDGDAPLLVIAVKDGATALRLEPGLAKGGVDRIAGNFVEGWARNCAMVRLDEWSRGARETVYHEYTHSILHLNSHSLPTWLDEGMAEFFAYTRFAGATIYMGAPTERSRELAYGRLLPVSEMLAVRSTSFGGDEKKTQLFYAEAWAMVHLMTFGEGMDQGRKLAALFDDLQSGKEQGAAFTARFGSVAGFEKELRDYARRFTLTAGVVPPAPAPDSGEVRERPLSEAEVDYALGSFHLSERDEAGGQALISQAMALNGELAGPHEEMGYVLYDKGEDEAARAQWREAARLDPSCYRARFALLMAGVPFARQSEEQRKETLGELRAIVRANPRFAPAYAEVALLQWRQGELDAAWSAADAAARLEPWRAGYRVLAGQILLAQGKGADAARIARSVAEFAQGTDRAEAVALWLEVPASQRDEGAALHYGEPSGVVVTYATLRDRGCMGEGREARLAVDVRSPEGKDASVPLQLEVARAEVGYSDTLYRGGSRRVICRHATEHGALMAYRPEAPGTGELVWLQILDDLPPIRGASRAARADGAAPAAGSAGAVP